MRRKKGFTLMELTIVLAIIGILVAIVVPSWGYYLEHSRLKAQNNKARVIFNAAQNVVTDLEFAERKYVSAYKTADAAGDSAKAANIRKNFYTPKPYEPDKNTWYFYVGVADRGQCDAEGKMITKDDAAEKAVLNKWNKQIADSIKRILDDDTVYKVYVENYTVTAVVSARAEGDLYLGSHPVTLEMLHHEQPGVFTNDVVKARRKDSVRGFKDMTDLKLK